MSTPLQKITWLLAGQSVVLTSVETVDEEVMAWLRAACGANKKGRDLI